jgi:hypothetical protein
MLGRAKFRRDRGAARSKRRDGLARSWMAGIGFRSPLPSMVDEGAGSGQRQSMVNERFLVP